uniref:Alpha-amylase n=1 Tax=Boehmeria nivea TaxID=83906 RepID=W6AN99_BOENI|nr:alpha-amylase 3 [Boehmeria nivea]
MIPLESIRIKDYAIETPLKTSSSSSGGDTIQEVEIDFDPKSTIAAINFVLKDEETGAWYQHKGRDFKVPLVNGQKKGSTKWPGPLGQLSSMFLKTKALGSEDEAGEPGQDNSPVEGFQEELPIVKEVAVCNSVTVTVRKCPDTANSLLYMETDLPGNVIIHWGVCRDDANKWEIPDSTPPYTLVFKDKALRTLLQAKEGGNGSSGFFTLDERFKGFLFVLKQDENTWLNCMGNDFYVPLLSSGIFTAVPKGDQSEKENSSISTVVPKDDQSEKKMAPKKSAKVNKSSLSDYANGVLNEIRNLVTDISDKKIQTAKNKAAQEEVLREIEKLAAEAYSIFRRSTVSTPPKEMELVVDSEDLSPPITSLGIGTGFEILCQGFNWESHKSGRWYMDIKEKAKELSSLGFTTIWLPPPTESVSPEGYMPKDLYSLNSRYGSMDELKEVVRTFREVGMKVLGDVVLNHRCAHYQNENGVWNKFGGRLNWDDRAIVADDPHFQGRGNKSSGDNFHAAPNIDHSQDFVRKDIKEWLCWLRKEIGYDGWRLDFVRGFWGGYVKDYIEATQPYFAVGEYWDSLNYTYGEMDHNQDAHRQRIVDWINATDGKACAFDVTTKGVLHTALGKCEYWRLSDEQGKPPGVMEWWPSRAVTFIENHDTGSTQGHWRFPSGKEMQGYAYILTHPGTPSVFYDHIFSDYQSEIAALISIRNRNKINSRSSVKITKTERDVYAAIINDRVAVKIGPGHYEPHSAGQIWIQALEGRDYKVWVASS